MSPPTTDPDNAGPRDRWGPAPVAPSEVDQDVERVRALAAAVGAAFAALHASGWHRDTAEDRHGGGSGGANDGGMASTAAGRRGVRAKLHTAARDVSRAADALEGALVAMHEVAEIIDEAAGHGPDEAFYPPTVTKAEVAGLVANQAGRDAMASLVVLRRARGVAKREAGLAKAAAAREAAQAAARARKAAARRSKGRVVA